MWDIRGQVLRLGAELEIDVRELAEAQRRRLLDEVFTKYTQGHRYSWAMWDSKFFAEHISRQAEDGWKWCGDFVGNQEVILFFNSSDEEAAFVVGGGEALVRLLGEMHRVEFYLTNMSTDYLLCFNHHDYLIACGAAREWLATYQTPRKDGS